MSRVRTSKDKSAGAAATGSGRSGSGAGDVSAAGAVAPMRLQKFLARAGVCSRRAAESLILNGVVTVNGYRPELGSAVVPGEDVVRVNGQLVSIAAEPRVVLLLNKPRGFLCSNADPSDARTVFEMVPPEFARRKLFCVGRLDKDSEGMLLITDDGDFANRVMHPSNGVEKRYRVTVNRPFDPLLIPRLLKGARDGDDFLRFKRVVWDKNEPDHLEVHLNQGRKREIRRLLEIFGFYVKTLIRFQIGALLMRGMPAGDCRKLTQKEIGQVLRPAGSATGGGREGVGDSVRSGRKTSAPSRAAPPAARKKTPVSRKPAAASRKSPPPPPPRQSPSRSSVRVARPRAAGAAAGAHAFGTARSVAGAARSRSRRRS